MFDFMFGLWLALREWASQTRESGRMHRQFADVRRANRQYRRAVAPLDGPHGEAIRPAVDTTP